MSATLRFMPVFGADSVVLRLSREMTASLSRIREAGSSGEADRVDLILAPIKFDTTHILKIPTPNLVEILPCVSRKAQMSIFPILCSSGFLSGSQKRLLSTTTETTWTALAAVTSLTPAPPPKSRTYASYTPPFRSGWSAQIYYIRLPISGDGISCLPHTLFN